ncbi:bacillithiol biosynthesis cysteine-adding enzyme BshC [Oceanobacillus alkalisoli]|uniref:bacillithiol biosynthesis cysteine-adding enzyme BshC n=1 Tax=Oceanobacillus alkalisoli TaxID=2925113 RepID=UPI001EE4E04E|nr:bacillithiol biosynthesis cysteine-adding enzyme BshC [Oceanobacillus alkalisoli]MCG5103584.1 bacillithiol biosynthesis cysteine-adding enzyme BshC [Oceanobacillus alkalisoli]
MRIDAVNIRNQGQLITDYRNNRSVMQFFDYHPFEAMDERMNELRNRTFKREELATILAERNTAWGAGETTLKAIEQLRNPESVVVVGGQQAGLLTGPLYTINKIISILHFAREQEKSLNVPVLPVFWIAGEDHDYEEVNHVFFPEGTELNKYPLKQSHYKKLPVTEITLDQELAGKWVDELFSKLPETIHTKDIYKMVTDTLRESVSFTDFFARIIHKLFQEEGIILIDAADKRIRNIEQDYFVRMIENQPKISQGVCEVAKELEEQGYTAALELEPADGHLFYHLDGERILLSRTEQGTWKGKQDEIELTTEELLSLAETNPEKLSNNVVTRPVMQELLLPTLAFIGGPGEISYWALLKPAFRALDLKMPPVLPRLSFTYLPETINKALYATDLTVEEAVNEGSTAKREQWLLTKQEPPIDDLAKNLQNTIAEAHKPLRKTAESIRDDVGALAEKNLHYVQREIEFLKRRMKLALEEKYAKDLAQFDEIQLLTHPEEGLQERMWNVFPFLNEYGVSFISEVTRSSFSFQNSHYVVYL